MRCLHLSNALLPLLLALAAGGAATAATAAAAKAPAAPPVPPNVMAEMTKDGAFMDLIAASPDVSSTCQSAMEGGMTVFCPSDDTIRAFLPKYKNLTPDGKADLLLFHAVPVHYSLGSLKSINGPMNMLATDGAAKNYNFMLQNQGDVITIKTAASAGTPVWVKSTMLDKDLLTIYVIDTVVHPIELFKPTPAPKPTPAAYVPKAAGGKPTHCPAPSMANAPRPAEDDAAPVDQKKDATKSAVDGVRRE